MSDEINRTLGLSDIEEMSKNRDKLVEHKPKHNSLSKKIEEFSDSDYLTVRQNLTDIADRGLESLESLIEIAKSSQDSKDYEAIAKLIKSVVDANKELSTVSSNKRKEFAASSSEVVGTKNVTNNMFVGTTQDVLKSLNRDNDIIDE